MATSNMNALYPSSNPQLQSILQGPVAILWDIENCPVPNDVRPEDVAGNIRTALQVHPLIQGSVTTFSAYGDFNAFPRRLREGCQRTGVKLVDVPNGRKDAADKAILVDMFLFALDNRPPSSIMLISGDVDFSLALHTLGQRGYAVILVIPSGVGVSSALSNAGRFVWDWPSIARGEGFYPPARTQFPPRDGSNELSGYLAEWCHISEPQDDEESIVYLGGSQNQHNTRNLTIVSQSTSGYPVNSTSRSLSLPSMLNEGTSYNQNGAFMWVQPGDLNGLKGQLVKLLELSGGCLPFARIMSDYQRCYGRPLFVSEYGVSKLVNLFKKMSDIMIVEGKGLRKLVHLRNVKPGPSAPNVVILKRDKKGKGIREEQCMNNTAGNSGGGSSSSLSDDEIMFGQEENDRNAEGKFGIVSTDNLVQFKLELQDILVSYACRCQILLTDFEGIYQQRYQKTLNYTQFGVDKLEDLFNKVRDVVELYEDPNSKEKFISAVA